MERLSTCPRPQALTAMPDCARFWPGSISFMEMVASPMRASWSATRLSVKLRLSGSAKDPAGRSSVAFWSRPRWRSLQPERFWSPLRARSAPDIVEVLYHGTRRRRSARIEEATLYSVCYLFLLRAGRSGMWRRAFASHENVLLVEALFGQPVLDLKVVL